MTVKSLLTSLGFLVVPTALAVADDSCTSRGGVTITVTGYAVGTPNTMRITLSSSAIAGTAVDALEQCNKKSDAAVEAIESLNVESLAVERRMTLFSSPAAGNPYGMHRSQATPAGTVASQSIVVKVDGIRGKSKGALSDIISRILDAGNRVGVGVGQIDLQASMQGLTNDPIEYFVADASELRAKALEDAIKKLRARRQRLVDSGVGVGKLTSVRDSTELQPHFDPWRQMMDARSKSKDKSSAYSTDPDKVTVSHRLTMVFEVLNDNP